MSTEPKEIAEQMMVRNYEKFYKSKNTEAEHILETRIYNSYKTDEDEEEFEDLLNSVKEVFLKGRYLAFGFPLDNDSNFIMKSDSNFTEYFNNKYEPYKREQSLEKVPAESVGLFFVRYEDLWSYFNLRNNSSFQKKYFDGKSVGFGCCAVIDFDLSSNRMKCFDGVSRCNNVKIISPPIFYKDCFQWLVENPSLITVPSYLLKKAIRKKRMEEKRQSYLFNSSTGEDSGDAGESEKSGDNGGWTVVKRKR